MTDSEKPLPIASEMKQIADGVILYKQALGDSCYEFSIEITHLQSLQISADFSQSENIYIEGTSSLQTSTTVHPFTRTIIATVKLLGDWRIQSKFTCTLIPPPKALILDAMKKDKTEIKLKLSNIKSVLGKVCVNLTPLAEIEKLLQKNNMVYVDADFPPEDFLENISFTWRKLSMVYPRSQLLPKEIEPYDVIEGEGKDWAMRFAFAVLAERPHCLNRLFITKNANPCGIYRVKIYKNNDWEFVTVDDCIPFVPGGGCLLCTTIDNMYWACVLEKAYCKAFSSYNVINYPGLAEIIADFTGCPYELHTLPGFNLQTLWNLIEEYTSQGFLCVFYSEFNPQPEPGVILQAKVAEDHGLIECRNLSDKAKKTKWSENSKFWTAKIKGKINPRFSINSFWMEIDEVIEIYNRMLVCKTAIWEEFRHKSKFIRLNDITMSNVYYSFDVEEKTTLIITLQQEDERDEGVSKCRGYLDAGIFVLNVQSDNSFKVEAIKNLIIAKVCSLEIDLEKGSYVILPFTSGCLLQSPPDISPEKTKIFNSGEVNPLLICTLNDVFNKFDSKNEKIIRYEKFRTITEGLGKIITEADFKQKILKKYLSKDDGLSLSGFKEFIIDTLKLLNEDAIWDWFGGLGYDKDFYSISSRLFFISLHSDMPLQVVIKKNRCDFEDQIYRHLIETSGIEIENKNGVKILYYLFEDVHCYLYGVCNFTEEGIDAKIDCGESENMTYSVLGGVHNKFIGPGDIGYIITALAYPHAESFLRSARCFW